MRLTCLSILPALALVAAAVFPSPSAAAVRVELKNGRSFVADECRESDGSLVCYKMGGSFVIEKRDIVSIKKTAGEEEAEEGPAPSEPAEVKDGDTKDDKTAAPAASGKRLDEIAARKKALLPEREKLVKERENLQEEVKKAPDWMTVDKFEALKKKISSLDERINGFNDEAKRLNEEEKTILDSQKNRGSENP